MDQKSEVAAKTVAELARAGILPRPVPGVAGPVQELRKLVRARHQRKRIAMINTIRETSTKTGLGCRRSAGPERRGGRSGPGCR
ncbi:MAG: hypothetical protein NNA18_12070 [Nitrospira sp.]|nr:hypothetical protein [Nitrospira sp.]